MTPVGPVKIAFTFKLSFTNQSVKMPNCSGIYFRSKMLQRTGKVWQKRLFLRREGLLLQKAPFSVSHRPEPSLERKSFVGHAPVAFLLHIIEISQGCFQVHSVLICLPSHQHHHEVPHGPVGTQVSHTGLFWKNINNDLHIQHCLKIEALSFLMSPSLSFPYVFFLFYFWCIDELPKPLVSHLVWYNYL